MAASFQHRALYTTIVEDAILDGAIDTPPATIIDAIQLVQRALNSEREETGLLSEKVEAAFHGCIGEIMEMYVPPALTSEVPPNKQF